MDGSTVPLADTEELREKYGCASNQTKYTAPTSRICVLYDALNHITIKGMLHPYFISEEKVSISCLENHADENTLLFFDLLLLHSRKKFQYPNADDTPP